MGFNNIDVKVGSAANVINALQDYNTVILKPNIVDNRNVLTQSMMNEKHTKYVIRWNYTLEGGTVTVPEDCIIEFAGGTIDNGVIVGNNTRLIYSKPIDEICKAERQGTWIYDTIVADEEDITSVDGHLKFKDRPATDGMGRKILRKNIVDGKNILTQAMISSKNTKYVIKYDYELEEDITIPEGCILEFDGGSINGAYTVTGTNTGVEAGLVKIFGTDVTLEGTWNIVEAYPEWFGAFPFKSLVEADGSGNYVDIASISEKLYGLSKTIRLSDGYYKTLGTINVRNLRGNGKTSCITAYASEDEYSVLTFGADGQSSSNRLWNSTIDGIGIYLQGLTTGLKKTSCLTVKSTTRCVINNITCWNYISKTSEFTDEELENVPDYCNYGIVFNGSTELLSLTNYVVSGDIGVYFKASTDQLIMANGYIEGNTYSYSGIYGKASSNFSITGYLDIALGLCGIHFLGNLSPNAIISVNNMRIEQIRNVGFDTHKNYVIKVEGNIGKFIIMNSYIPSFTNTIYTEARLAFIGCLNVNPGATYLGNEFINAHNDISFIDCRLFSNGKIILADGYECRGILTPTVEGNPHTGISVKNGIIAKKISKDDIPDSKTYKFNKEGVFELTERNILPSRYSNFFKAVPATFKSKIKFFIIEIETIDDEYYQKTSIRYSYNTETNKLVFKDVLFNYGDNVFYPSGESPAGLIAITGDGVNNLGWLYFNSTLSREISFEIKYTCIAPNYDGNRS